MLYPNPAKLFNHDLRLQNIGGARGLWLSSNGELIGRWGAKELVKSDRLFRGQIRTLIHTFDQDIGHAARMDNGTIIVFCKDGIYTVDDSTSPATVTKKHDFTSPAMVPEYPNVNILDVRGAVAIACTYGNPKNEEDPFKYVYVTFDYGETWEQHDSEWVVDAGDLHMHGVSYDPYRDYLWVCASDGVNSQTYWSYDRGVTWKPLFDHIRFQAMQVLPLPDAILLGMDSRPNGVLRVPFESASSVYPRPDMSRAEFCTLLSWQDENAMYGWNLRSFADTSRYPYRILMPFIGTTNHTQFNPLLYSGDGRRFYALNSVPRGDNTPAVGDWRVFGVLGITPPDFTIDGVPAGDRAVCTGGVWNGESWTGNIIEFDLPEWQEVD